MSLPALSLSTLAPAHAARRRSASVDFTRRQPRGLLPSAFELDVGSPAFTFHASPVGPQPAFPSSQLHAQPFQPHDRRESEPAAPHSSAITLMNDVTACLSAAAAAVEVALAVDAAGRVLVPTHFSMVAFGSLAWPVLITAAALTVTCWAIVVRDWPTASGSTRWAYVGYGIAVAAVMGIGICALGPSSVSAAWLTLGLATVAAIAVIANGASRAS